MTFTSNLISGSTYLGLGAEDRTILAGKLALGTLDSAPLSQLPSDQRVYAGGGGSIRPYAYLMAGPLASNSVPIGGKSSLVLNLEARVKITDTIGVVPFVDGGRYYESPLPQLGRSFLLAWAWVCVTTPSSGRCASTWRPRCASAATARLSRSISASVKLSDAHDRKGLLLARRRTRFVARDFAWRLLACCRPKSGKRGWQRPSHRP